MQLNEIRAIHVTQLLFLGVLVYNKLAKLQATQVGNYDLPTDLLTGVK